LSKISSSCSAVIVCSFLVFSGSPHRNDPNGSSTHRAERDPYLVITFGNDGMTNFRVAFCRDLNAIFIKPENLGFQKVDAVLPFIDLALDWIIFKLHAV